MHPLSPRPLALLVLPALLIASACAQRASPPPPRETAGSTSGSGSGSGSGTSGSAGTGSGTESGTGAVGTGTTTGTRTGTTTANPRTPPRDAPKEARPTEPAADSPWARTSPARTTPCPEPKSDVICTKEYRPVACDGCQYANPCLAGAAGFQTGQCAPVQEGAGAGQNPCPEPKPDVVCAMIYDPVICNGCRYSNGCVAGAAGFKKEQCAPAPDE